MEKRIRFVAIVKKGRMPIFLYSDDDEKLVEALLKLRFPEAIHNDRGRREVILEALEFLLGIAEDYFKYRTLDCKI